MQREEATSGLGTARSLCDDSPALFDDLPYVVRVLRKTGQRPDPAQHVAHFFILGLESLTSIGRAVDSAPKAT